MSFFSAYLPDAIREVFFCLVAVYFGFAFRVMFRYFSAPPRSPYRRIHVVLVAAGTSVLVIGTAGLVHELMGEPLRWYGTPTAIVGIVLIIVALYALGKDPNVKERPHGQRSYDRKEPKR